MRIANTAGSLALFVIVRRLEDVTLKDNMSQAQNATPQRAVSLLYCLEICCLNPLKCRWKARDTCLASHLSEIT